METTANSVLIDCEFCVDRKAKKMPFFTAAPLENGLRSVTAIYLYIYQGQCRPILTGRRTAL